jgi:hypothetical protein
MSSRQNEENPDKQRPDDFAASLGASFSEQLTLEETTDADLQQQTSSGSTRYTAIGSDISRGDRTVPDENLVTSISPEVSNDFSRHVGDPVAINSSNDGGGLPIFLGETQVLAALRRAGDLFQQRHELNGTTNLAPPLSDWARVREIYGRPVLPYLPSLESDFSPAPVNLPVPPRVPIAGYIDAPYAPPGSGIHAKFVTGQESASVLKITKRPKLRAKDLAHRQSLGPSGPDLLPSQQASSDEGHPFLATTTPL